MNNQISDDLIYRHTPDQLETNHWDIKRRQWTKGQIHQYDPYQTTSFNKAHSVIENIEEKDYCGIYDALIAKRNISSPLPLGFVITVLVCGWKRDGLWEDTNIIKEQKATQ